jgi:prefoldin subunit 5
MAYKDFTFEQKINVLETNLENRLHRLPEFREGIEKNIMLFKKKRAELVKRINDYKNDEFIVEILKNNLEYIDTQYEKEIAEFQTEIERLDASVPTIKNIIKDLEGVKQYPRTYLVLERFIDLFLQRTIEDWVELEKLEQDKEVEIKE